MTPGRINLREQRAIKGGSQLRFLQRLDMLTLSPPLSRSLDLSVCLTRTPEFSGFALALCVYVAPLPLAPFTRFPAARLWLKDAVTRVKERPGFPSLEDTANLPPPDVIAAEIVEDLQAALRATSCIVSRL